MKWEYKTELCEAWKSFGVMWGKIDAQKLTDRLFQLAEEDWELVSAWRWCMAPGSGISLGLCPRPAQATDHLPH